MTDKEKLDYEDSLTEQEFIEYYKKQDIKQYEKPSVTSDIMVFTVRNAKLCVLLIKRAHHPFKDKWAIPGGFVEMTESTYDAAVRELEEETGITGVHLEQLYTFSDVNRDPRMRIISVAHMAIIPYDRFEYSFGDDAKDSMLFEIYRDGDNVTKLVSVDSDRNIELTSDDLAFDHAEILNMAIERLHGKCDYTDVALEFLNNKKRFTLKEVHEIFEAIYGHTLKFPTNFDKKFKEKYVGRLVLIEQVSMGKGKPTGIYKIK